MKSCNEMVNSLMERLDAYEVRQKQKRKTVMKIASAACAFVLVAAVGVGLWQGGVLDPVTPPVEEPNVGTTASPTENDGPGVGGDVSDEDCQVHNFYYHSITGNFTDEQWDSFLAEYSGEEINIVNFVRFHNITREEYIEAQGGMWTEENLDDIVWNHGNGCPYTKNQYLDAIYGDNAELTAWVFAPNSIWPMADNWSLTGDPNFVPENWPPEGYGFGETRPSKE